MFAWLLSWPEGLSHSYSSSVTQQWSCLGWTNFLLFLSRSNEVQTARKHWGSAVTKGTERGAVISPLLASLSSGGCFTRVGASSLARMGCKAVTKGSAACFSLSLQPGDGGAEPMGMCKLSNACGAGLYPFLFPWVCFFSAKLSLWSREGAGRAACPCPPSWGYRGGSERL